MAVSALPRMSRRPFIMLAIAAAVATVGVGIWFSQGRSSGPTAATTEGSIPSPLPVPTKVSDLVAVREGRITTWHVPEALVGLRSVAIGPDGRVWVTEQNGAKVDALDGDELTRYEVPQVFPDGGAFSFGWGPDGALWFTGFPAGTLGRVMPNGAVNLFGSRGEGATTLGIAQGPDGSMWTTDPNLGAVVRIGVDGTVTPITVSPDGGQTQRPGFIVQGVDANMWFTIPDASEVAEVSTSGEPTITRFEVPGHVVPRNIVASGDGALWVSLEDRPALARVDEATGDVSIVPLRGSVATEGLNDLALAPDGTLWITTPSETVLHVATNGRIIERLRIPGASYADGVAVAPDGAVWVAARDDLIAKIEP